jgi:hypothetical protein
MSLRALPFCLLLFGFSEMVSAQHAVDPVQRYHRLICLVHLTGSGKSGDPVLPEYAPVASSAVSTASAPASGPTTTATAAGNSSTAPSPSATAAGARSGILAWSSQITDDGKMAIVHYVAVDRVAFASILADTRPEIRVFEIGKDKPDAIEAEMKKYKKDFTLDSIQVVAQ